MGQQLRQLFSSCAGTRSFALWHSSTLFSFFIVILPSFSANVFYLHIQLNLLLEQEKCVYPWPLKSKDTFQIKFIFHRNRWCAACKICCIWFGLENVNNKTSLLCKNCIDWPLISFQWKMSIQFKRVGPECQCQFEFEFTFPTCQFNRIHSKNKWNSNKLSIRWNLYRNWIRSGPRIVGFSLAKNTSVSSYIRMVRGHVKEENEQMSWLH